MGNGLATSNPLEIDILTTPPYTDHQTYRSLQGSLTVQWPEMAIPNLHHLQVTFTLLLVGILWHVLYQNTSKFAA